MATVTHPVFDLPRSVQVKRFNSAECANLCLSNTASPAS